MYLHVQYAECRVFKRLCDTEHALMILFFFCQALKHSGRLIKFKPQAAAPSGSRTKKYSQSLSYITRKMRGSFEVHQSYFFFSLGSHQEGSWCPNAGTA